MRLLILLKTVITSLVQNTREASGFIDQREPSIELYKKFNYIQLIFTDWYYKDSFWKITKRNESLLVTSRQAERKVDGWGGEGNHDDIVEERNLQENTYTGKDQPVYERFYLEKPTT